MEIRIERCRRKSIGMRHKDGVIYVRAPLYISDEELNESIKKMLPKLEAKILKNEAMRASLDKDGYWYLGECFKVKVMVCDFNSVGLDGDTMIIFHTPKKTSEQVYREFIHYETLRLAEQIIDIYLARLNMSKPEIVAKPLISVWGSYNYIEKKLTLSDYLAIVPMSNFEETICHELCHEYYHDHSKGFHELLEKLYPNHRKYERELRTYASLLK